MSVERDKERARIQAGLTRLRRQVVRSPEEGGDSIDSELGSLLNEVSLIVGDVGAPSPDADIRAALLKLHRVYADGLVTMDADSFDEVVLPYER